MATICASSILACGMRVTLLDDVGNVANQADNSYVTNNLVQIGVDPNIQTGAEPTLPGGCACLIANAKFPNLLKRFDFAIALGQLDVQLMSLMTGGALISSGSNAIGMDWPDSGITCGATAPPKVALEVWSYVWVGNAQSTVLPYWHWVWPMTQWQIGSAVLNGTDFFQPALTGFSLGNPAWGHGPYDDDPGTVIGDLGSVWQTADAIPTQICDYTTVTPSS